MSIEVIEIKEDKTLKELLNELSLAAPVLFEVNGEAFYPDGNYDRVLRKGDKIKLIRILAGG